MKFIFTLILTLSINLSVSSQEDSINFFKTLLKTEIKPESQVQILINLSRLNSLNHPDSSLIYANRAIIKAKEANFKKGLAHSFFIKGKAIESEKDYKKAIELFLLCSESFSKLKMIPNIAKSYHRLGFNYYKTGNNDSSLIYLEKALTLFDNKKNPSNVADAKRLMALSYWSMGNYAKGITSINSALQQFISLQDSNQIALCHNTKGAILWGLTDYENALKNFFEALSIRVATHDKEDKIIIVYNNIGMVYHDWAKKDDALKYFKLAEQTIPGSKNDLGKAYTNLNLGTHYMRLKQTDLAIPYLLNSLEGYCLLNNYNGISLCKTRLGQCYNFEKKYNDAKTSFFEAIENSEKTKNTHRKSLALYNLAKTENLQKNYHRALKFAQQSLELSIKGSYKNLIYLTYELQSELYENLGDLGKSVSSLKKASLLKDSLFKEKTAVQYDLLNLKHEFDAKELENNNLKKENLLKEKIIQYQYIAVFFIVILLLAISVLTYILFKGRKKLQDLNKTKDKIFSIISHDMRAPVGNLNQLIDLMIAKENDSDYRDLLNEFKPFFAVTYSTLDNLLIWARSNREMLDLNIENINLWKVTSDMEVLLINLADRKNISITNKIPPDILVDADKVTIQTVIRNLISNAIKFTPEGGNIVIKSKISNKQVILSITDSGPGIKLEDQEKILSEKSFTNFGTNNEKGSGLGLLLCKELVEKNKGKLWFESTEGKGTKFSFTIPLIKRTN